ncbi:MAG: pilus assembly protein CpaE, partial [Pseudomonadota bacterium]
MALSFSRDPAPSDVEALVFAEGFEDFDALAQDLDTEFGAGQWEEVPVADIDQVLENAGGVQFAVVAISSDSQEQIEETAKLIKRAREADLIVMLIAGDISSRAMHRLLREGAAEFVPYPDADGELPEAVGRLRLARTGNLPTGFGMAEPVRKGQVITGYGAAGGVGASTFMVNLSWELAIATRKQGRKVALLDFNFQYGSIATYLDVPRREAVYELVSEASGLDQTGLTQALSTFQDKL